MAGVVDNHQGPQQLQSPDYRTAIGLFLVGLVSHLVRLDHWVPLPDEVNYALCAQHLLKEHSLTSSNIMFFPPLFVYLAALLQSLRVELLMSVRLVSAVFGAAVIPFITLILTPYYGRVVSRTSGLFLLPFYSLNVYSRLGQVEALLLSLLTLSFLTLTLGTGHGRKRYLFLTGVTLGLALWAKEVALGSTLVAILFILLTRRDRLGSFLVFILGWLGLAAPLLLIGRSVGTGLLFELSAARGYDINMQPLPPFKALVTTGANIIFNLVPRCFSPIELAVFLLLGPPFLLLIFWLTIRQALRHRPFSLLVMCYLVIHLPFFVLFSRRFHYYLLPTALFLLAVGVAESLAGLRAGPSIGTHPVSRKWAVVTLIPATLLLAFNIYADGYLYFDRGTHQSFRSSLLGLRPSLVLASSHPELTRYIANRENLNLTVLPLFKPNSYAINWAVVDSPTVSAVLVKQFYYDVLAVRDSTEWRRLTQLYPQAHRELDARWSFRIPATGPFRTCILAISRTTRPVGVVLFSR